MSWQLKLELAVPMRRVMDDLLACAVEVHEELRSDPRRVREETVPVGVQIVTRDGHERYYLRNCLKCRGTMAFETDVDAQARETD